MSPTSGLRKRDEMLNTPKVMVLRLDSPEFIEVEFYMTCPEGRCFACRESKMDSGGNAMCVIF